MVPVIVCLSAATSVVAARTITTMYLITSPFEVGGRRRLCTRHPPPRGSRSRFETKQRAVVFIGEQIEQPVGALPHFADALPELGEHRFAPQLLHPGVEHDSFEMSGAGNATLAQRSNDEI